MNLLAEWQAAQDRSERRRWTLSTLAILLGVMALFSARYWRRGSVPPVSTPALPMVVELAFPPAAPTAPSAQVVGPRRQEAPRPRPRPSQVPPDLPRMDTPLPSEMALPAAPPAAPESPPRELPAAPQTSAPPGEDAPPASLAAAPRQGARSLAESTAQMSFRERLLGHLQRHKRYPPSAQARRQQGVPYVRFTMDRAGRLLASRLERSSGHAALDAEALALLVRAQPLPALPEDLSGDTLEVVVPIEFYMKR